MIITRHTGINRGGVHERPVTIQDDDGRLFDTVLIFDKAPSIPAINQAATEYVLKIKVAESEMPEEQPVQVAVIEAVLKGKGIMELTEKWASFVVKPVVKIGKMSILKKGKK